MNKENKPENEPSMEEILASIRRIIYDDEKKESNFSFKKSEKSNVDKKEVLESLILHLRNKHGIRKRSLVMEDREDGGYLFFMYQPCNPNWIIEFTTANKHRMEEE